jgi:succinate-acetate transporter protein
VVTCSIASSIHRIFYCWKILKSQLLAEFQSFVFGQILADFGSFGQFWAEFAALTVAESMPEERLKS